LEEEIKEMLEKHPVNIQSLSKKKTSKNNTSPRGSKSKSVAVFLCFLCSLILAALGTEVAVRVFHLAPPLALSQYCYDKYLPYKPCPLSRKEENREGIKIEYKHNSLGFRDEEHALAKGNGVFRILAVGDSFTYGLGIPYGQSYLRLLENTLNSRTGIHPRIEIIKMGIPRFFSEPERKVLQYYGMQYHPDLVLVGFLRNDVIDTFAGTDSIRVSKDGYLISREGEVLGELARWLFIHSHACRAVFSRYVAYKKKSKPRAHWSDLCYPEGYHEKDWKKVEAENKKMVEVARGANAKIAFVYIPEINDCAVPAMRLEKWCDSQGVPSINTVPYMESRATLRNMRDLFWRTDNHYNFRGYQALAEAVYSELTEKHLVP